MQADALVFLYIIRWKSITQHSGRPGIRLQEGFEGLWRGLGLGHSDTASGALTHRISWPCQGLSSSADRACALRS